MNPSATKSSSLEIEINPNAFEKNKLLKIDSLGISYGKKSLLFSEVKHMRYGSQIVYAYGIESRKNYFFDFDGIEKLNIRISASKFKASSIPEADKQYSQIIDVLWKNYTSKVVDGMIKKLNCGDVVRVGNFEVSQKGIKIFYKKFLFFSKEMFLPWTECLKGAGPGYLYIQWSKNKKVEARSMFLNTWDLNALHSLLNYLWEAGNCFKLERGEKL